METTIECNSNEGQYCHYYWLADCLNAQCILKTRQRSYNLHTKLLVQKGAESSVMTPFRNITIHSSLNYTVKLCIKGYQIMNRSGNRPKQCRARGGARI